VSENTFAPVIVVLDEIGPAQTHFRSLALARFHIDQRHTEEPSLRLNPFVAHITELGLRNSSAARRV